MPGKRSQANLNRKPKSYLFKDTLVNTIGHWPVPPRAYVEFSQDRQGRLVHVRTVVAATCIKIYSQVAQRNEDPIACSVLLSLVLYLLYSHISSNHLKRKAAYTGREVEMCYT